MEVIKNRKIVRPEQTGYSPVVRTVLNQLCEGLLDEGRESAICASENVRSILLDSIYYLMPKLIYKTHHCARIRLALKLDVVEDGKDCRCLKTENLIVGR